MFLAGAAVLAAVHVLEVLTATHWWRYAEIGAFLLLAVHAAVRTQSRWLGPVVLSPLLLDALLTIPPAEPQSYGWQVLTQAPDVNPWVDALGQGFRQGGPVLLFVLALLAARPRPRSRPRGWRLTVAAVLGAVITAYAIARVTQVAPASGFAASVAAVLVPIALALAALSLPAVGRGWATPLGGLLIAAATLPMTDALLGSVPVTYAHSAATGDGFFGWSAITPTRPFPAPVAAIEEALLLAGVLALMARARFRR